jgi:nitroreductase
MVKKFAPRSEDMRAPVPNQDGFKNAGMIARYIINRDRVPTGKIEWADIEIGCMRQSIYLEALSLGLGTCLFAYIPFEKVAKAFGLNENQMLRITQAVAGWR